MISPSSATGELTVVNNLAAIGPQLRAMIGEPLPGFQIGPEVEVDDALAKLQEQMQEFTPGFSFSDISGRQNPDTLDRPHFDESYAKRMAGIALHEPEAGEGDAYLQLLHPTVVDSEGLTPSMFVGPCLKGDASPGMKTVFSERIYSPERGVLLGATYHLFTTSGSTPRKWLRYTSFGYKG